MTEQLNLSATSLQCFKQCPMCYYYRYVLGLTPIEDTDALRIGSNYHRIQEIADAKPGGVCECIIDPGEGLQAIKDFCTHAPDCDNSNCILCQGTGRNPDDPMDAVIRHLNERYSTPPISKTVEEWETERIILLYTLTGYRWWYDDAGYDVESLEQKFNIPLISPLSGAQLKARLRGKIDRVFAAGANRFVHDYKSTTKNIDPDSTFWAHLTLDTQTRLYTYAAKQLGLGMCGVLYDAWHKPGIKPKKLTQGESKKFVADGEYCKEQFEVSDTPTILVNDKQAETEPGKKEGTFAIRETPEMFGARLLQDITTRPEFYFARKEIVHHSSDLEAFEWELFNLYHSIRQMKLRDRWWRNEAACEATYKCAYLDFCYNNINLGPDDVPENFVKRGR